MSRKQTIIRGTFILTFTGLLTRVIGFFYRIFLSRIFQAEGVGLYQLIFPVYALCFSLTSAGIQTALSRIVAKYKALNQEKTCQNALKTALFLSMILSFAALIVVQKRAEPIASTILQEPRCAELLTSMSLAFPFAAIHSCICGYYLGMKKTEVPAVSQLLEQLFRVLSVVFFCQIGLHFSMGTPVTIAVLGMVCGEIVSAIYSIFMLHETLFSPSGKLQDFLIPARELLHLSIPLTANRVLLNLLQSAEAILIPLRLQMYGLTLSDSLSTYGVLTGMALPCILFPSAITNSVSTMLLPTVAELQVSDLRDNLPKLIRKVVFCCFSLGFLCMAGFFVLGNIMGNLIFHNSEAGNFIITLAFICPFLYTNTAGLLMRICSVYFLIPKYGILAYLHGLLASQFLISALSLYGLLHYGKRKESD